MGGTMRLGARKTLVAPTLPTGGPTIAHLLYGVDCTKPWIPRRLCCVLCAVLCTCPCAHALRTWSLPIASHSGEPAVMQLLVHGDVCMYPHVVQLPWSAIATGTK